MSNSNPSFIQVTQNFEPLLNRLAFRLLLKIDESPFFSIQEVQEWLIQEFEKMLFPAELSSAVIRYLEPKLQFTKSGPLAYNSYAAPRKRQHYSRRLPSTPCEPTPKRLVQQNRMRQAVQAWQQSTPAIRGQWQTAAIPFHTDGVYLFRGIYICLLVDNQPIPNPFVPTPALLHYYRTRHP